MTVISMTGFARVEGRHKQTHWVLEARSVNGRNFDFKARFPQGYESLESTARELAKSHFSRGQIQLNLSLKRNDTESLMINRVVLEAYIEAGRMLVQSGKVKPARLDGLLGLKGVIVSENDGALDDERLKSALSADFERICTALKESRRQEGAALLTILSGQLDRLEANLIQAMQYSDEQAKIISTRFENRLNALWRELNLGPELNERVLQEAAIAAVKADVTEELDRLGAHLNAARVLLEQVTSQGRTLDFLAQEFMREANTLCAKSAINTLTHIGLELKSIIDQFREQCQNVE